MNRNQVFVTLEFIDGFIRISLGEFYNSNFYIFDVFTIPSKGLEKENIVDVEEVIKSIEIVLQQIKEQNDITVRNITLCLPSYHATMIEKTITSRIEGENHLTTKENIQEIITSAYWKSRSNEGESIVEIIPIDFTLSNEDVYEVYPIGYRTETVKIKHNLVSLPKELIDTYNYIFKKLNLKLSNNFLDYNCFYNGVFGDKLVDVNILNIGRFYTSLNIYKKGRLIDQFIVDKGVENIIEEVETKLGLIKSKARTLVLINGFAKQSESKDISIAKLKQNNKTNYIKEEQLATIIEEQLEIIFDELITKSIHKLKTASQNVVITGYGATIKKIDEKFNDMSNMSSHTVLPSILGINRPNNIQTLGLIKFAMDNLNVKQLNNIQNIDNNKSSEKVSKKERSASVFDTLTLDEDDL